MQDLTPTQRAALADIEEEIARAKPVKAAKKPTKKAPAAPAKKNRAKEIAKAKREAGIRTLQWREVNRDKVPLPTLHNVRLAIDALGIEVTFDTFHNRMEIGQRGRTKHVVHEGLIGEVSDDRIIQLRRFISDSFGFDPPSQLLRDSVRSIALEHCYNPVCDEFETAQGKWDGKPRIDRLAVDYFNCADTSLNRAQGRKFAIALIRRARQPGCKFDTILVLESEEGFNKSTAFWVLAGGDDNFSDEAIIGAGSKEVQEQIAAKLIHESAELAGMSKREVENVKQFASRTHDRARAAYGHFLREQPRHCVMVGTTNSDEYLQSQTGNRRFWPMRVLKPIDIEKLKRDRLQILGEAAHYEAKGESLVLDESLWAAAAVEQEKRRIKDVWEDTLADQVHGYVIDGEERISSASILTDILEIPHAQQTQGLGMRLSNVMKQLGWKRHPNNNVVIDGKVVKGYYRETSRKPEADNSRKKPPGLPEPRKAKKP